MDDSKTVWCGNISDKVTEELLYELFLQGGPLEKVKIPTDKEGRKSNFAFITFKHEESVNYVLQLMGGTRLFDRNLNIKPRNNGANKPQQQPLIMNDHHSERDQQFGFNKHPSFQHSPNRHGNDQAMRFGDNSPRRFGKNRHPHWDQDPYRERENRHHDYKYGDFQDEHNSPNHRRPHSRHNRGHSNEKHNRRNPHRY